MSLSLAQLAAAASSAPIHFEDLGLSPNLFTIGSFSLRWYSLAYLAGIFLAYWHTSKAIKTAGAPLAQRHIDDLFFYCTLGVILGGRLGYATFYTGGNTGIPSLWAHPGQLVQLWHGGMSFHGGLIGVVLAISWVCWRNKLSILRVADYVSVAVPFGMLFGRLANFVNGELWGRVAGTDVPWAIVFKGAGELPRHPSQLYEALLEGLLLALILVPLFWKTRARFRPGLLVGIFTLGIGIGRFVVEYFREPDEQLQEFARQTGLSMGQWLTIPLIALGLFFLIRALRRPELGSSTPTPQ
ncbi:prolipoprotein diacylglyceryl transferase [Novosphingobium sp. UBA6272]|uniref:prolipoprotein diacylglyceryl transferase n=1 Tax=Novosphingobium sp. UBA6272 TaxID=1946984 RepID=UPI0039C98B72